MLLEKNLVSKILEGDLNAFQQLVTQYEKLVFSIAARLVNNKEDIEDICQEVFIKIYKGLPGFAFESRLSTWIARIAHRTTLNHLKRYGRRKGERVTGKLNDLPFDQADPEEQTIQRNISGYINRLIEKMPPHYGMLLTLYHIHEFTYQEIEEITGMPLGTVKGYLFRARKLLKQKIELYLNKETI